MSKFNNDLAWGNYWEEACIPLIQKYFEKVLKDKKIKCRFITANNSTTIAALKKWDLKFGLYKDDVLIKYMTVEIKADRYDSNNVFIEKRCRQIDSGVFCTTADFFLYIMPRHHKDNFYIVQSFQLKEILMNDWRHAGKYGGDGRRVFGFCINKDEFRQSYINGGGDLLTVDFKIPEHFEVAKLNIYIDNGHTTDFS